MSEITVDKTLVSYCGLYCGACKRYLKGGCPGCIKNEKAGWCKVRKCCIENSYQSCAECKEYTDVSECKKLNNFFSKVFAFIFRTDRLAGITMIKEKGYENFAKLLAEEKRVAIKK